MDDEKQVVRSQLSVADVKRQVNEMATLLKDVMQKGTHFDQIPGAGPKPVLLKGGAEKLSLMFRLAPRYKVSKTDFEGGHREYMVECELYHIATNQYWGGGVGSCSTMEKKYKYRRSEGENTGKPVPKEYWKDRDASFIGGKGFQTKKDQAGRWMIFTRGENTENPDIADTYNTVLKMAKKRAHVDAILTATSASDIFTQDAEDMDLGNVVKDVTPKPTNRMSAAEIEAAIDQEKGAIGAAVGSDEAIPFN